MYKNIEFRSDALTKIAKMIFGEDILKDIYYKTDVLVDDSGAVDENHLHNINTYEILNHSDNILQRILSGESPTRIEFDDLELYVVLKNGKKFCLTSSEWGRISVK